MKEFDNNQFLVTCALLTWRQKDTNITKPIYASSLATQYGLNRNRVTSILNWLVNQKYVTRTAVKVKPSSYTQWKHKAPAQVFDLTNLINLPIPEAFPTEFTWITLPQSIIKKQDGNYIKTALWKKRWPDCTPNFIHKFAGISLKKVYSQEYKTLMACTTSEEVWRTLTNTIIKPHIITTPKTAGSNLDDVLKEWQK